MTSTLVVANLGTTCAEFAGVAAACELAGISRYVSVPVAAVGVGVLVLKGGFHRVEHVLLALSAVFVAYIAAGILAHPDWGAAAKGMVTPSLPSSAFVLAAATVGTTLAPWGLAFIQSYSADKELQPKDLTYERVDVIGGALMTGIIGFFIVVACAATLHEAGHEVSEARDAADALQPLAGSLASTPLRRRAARGRAARRGGRPALHGLLGQRRLRQGGEAGRRLRRGAVLLHHPRRRARGGRRDRADPRPEARPRAGLDPGPERRSPPTAPGRDATACSRSRRHGPLPERPVRDRRRRARVPPRAGLGRRPRPLAAGADQAQRASSAAQSSSTRCWISSTSSRFSGRRRWAKRFWCASHASIGTARSGS